LYSWSNCAGATSSDYDCSSDVIGKQTGGCGDSSAGFTQPVERITCSDMMSPETDAEGIGFHPWRHRHKHFLGKPGLANCPKWLSFFVGP